MKQTFPVGTICVRCANLKADRDKPRRCFHWGDRFTRHLRNAEPVTMTVQTIRESTVEPRGQAMPPDEIDQLEAGPAIDALVAEMMESKPDKHPSTDIADAADASWAAINLLAGAHGGMGSLAVWWNPYGVWWEAELSWSDGHRINATAKTEALARCRVAAMAAVERDLIVEPERHEDAD